MAISYNDPVDIGVQHLTIGGKLVTATVAISQMDDLLIPEAQLKDEIKRKLLQDLVDYLLQNKLCEFTMQDDLSRGTKLYRARCYVAPDEQVKLIRVYNIK